MDSLACGVWAVQFETSNFEFEMQDSSNFKFPLSLPEVGGEAPFEVANIRPFSTLA